MKEIDITTKNRRNKILIETPINIKPNATKVLIRVTKFNQKEKHNLNIENAHIRSTF